MTSPGTTCYLCGRVGHHKSEDCPLRKQGARKMENLSVLPLLIAAIVGFLAAMILMSARFASHASDDHWIDTRRIDFLQDNEMIVMAHWSLSTGITYYVCDADRTGNFSQCSPSIREAIDDAYETWRIKNAPNNINEKAQAS